MATWRAVIGALVLGLVGCHQCGHENDVGWDGFLIGGACGRDGDCYERCERGKDFPDGTCTVDCRDDGDCPDGTVCVEKAGGICILACDVAADCRDRYACKDVPRHGSPGMIEACIH